MTDTLETVVIVREDHPDGKVLINKADMKKDDVIYKEKPKQRVRRVKEE